MTPISKRKHRRRRKSADELGKLKRELETSGVLGERKIILQESSGDQEKMSTVLLDFIAPYKGFTTAYDEYDRLIAVAIVAWNAAVLKEMGKPDLLKETMKAVMPSGDRQTRQDFQAIVKELMERKARYFSDNKRIIVSYHLSETKKDYHLSVASTL